VSDGACALILAREEKAKRLTSKPIWITGIGQCYDTHNLGDRDLAKPRALELAAKMAYRMAGIDSPERDLDLIELSEYYSYQELLWMGGLGICSYEETGRMLEKGTTEISGKLPVNPSGGVLSGRPKLVAGMAGVIEAALQLRGEAGERQVEDATIALAHGSGGPCGQQHCIIILNKGS